MIDAGKTDARDIFPNTPFRSCPRPTARRFPFCSRSRNTLICACRAAARGLIRAVAECSKVPVIKHYKGVCHVFVDADADLKMAEEIAMNAKVQRPAVCNAMETLLVDKAIAAQFLPAIGAEAQRKAGRIARRRPMREAILKSRMHNTQIRHQTARDRTGLVHRIQRLHPERPRRGRREAGD